MELCTPTAFSNLPNHKLINSNQWRPSLFIKKPSKSRFNPGLFYWKSSSIRSKSETEAYELYIPPTVEEKDDGAFKKEAPIEESRKDNKIDDYTSMIYEPPKFEKTDDGAVQNEAPIEDSSKDKDTLIYEPPKVEEKDDAAVQTEAPIEDSELDFDSQLSKLFDKLNIKYDPEDSSSIILFGGAAVTALWLTTAIVGAIDSIPLFPKLLEVVGLGYTLWFSTRYLLFKKNRDELAAKIEELKQEVLGSSDD
ncbi:uncharacterized protein LOC132053301 [Lycium ferocissimum]|uniref:uncharacterized protein LOC132053301 n=1 Tax=Lycium ferocissimum TaxID=112874 RepID=UPI002814B473|nr:uncharacterized protein LOC132053301 [Lycium ferocissimum]